MHFGKYFVRDKISANFSFLNNDIIIKIIFITSVFMHAAISFDGTRNSVGYGRIWHSYLRLVYEFVHLSIRH